MWTDQKKLGCVFKWKIHCSCHISCHISQTKLVMSCKLQQNLFHIFKCSTSDLTAKHILLNERIWNGNGWMHVEGWRWACINIWLIGNQPILDIVDILSLLLHQLIEYIQWKDFPNRKHRLIAWTVNVFPCHPFLMRLFDEMFYFTRCQKFQQ